MGYTVINVNGTYTLTMCMYVVTPLAHKRNIKHAHMAAKGGEWGLRLGRNTLTFPVTPSSGISLISDYLP